MHKHLFTAALLLTTFSVFSQDILKRKDGTELQVVVLNKDGKEIEYKLFNFQSGQSFKIDKKDVLYVQAANGITENFEQAQAVKTPSAAASTTTIPSSAPVINYSKTIEALSLQVQELKKGQDAQTKAVVDALNAVNQNITALKNQLTQNNNIVAKSNVAPAPKQVETATYTPTKTTASNTAEKHPSPVSSSYPMPDFDDTPYYYEESTNTIIPLEKENYNIQNKAKGLFGAGVYITVQGAAAKVRYSHSQQLQFLIHFQDERTDPSTLFTLIQFTVNQKNNNNLREYLVKQIGLGHSETTTNNISSNVKKVGAGLYLISFREVPTLGEYGIAIEKTKQGYCFGID
ncbi:MAG: hypothetical protein KF706_07100 [Chitinophagales bacterium]|nr:hypothetical protein [Chitinophagales bacterium]